MKKVSLNKIDKMLKSDIKENINIVKIKTADETIDIEVKPIISQSECNDIVQYVANSVWSVGDDGINEYRPELKEVLFTAAVLLNYTNLKIEGDIDRINKIRYSAIWDEINNYISQEQIRDIRLATDKKISFLKDSSVNNMTAIRKAIENLAKKMESSFENIDTDMILKAFDKLSNIDERKIVDIALSQTVSEGTEA